MPSALDAVHEYYKVFSTLDMDGIVSFFNVPFMAIGPQGVAGTGDHAAVVAWLTPIVDRLKGMNYGRSEYVARQVTTLSETATFLCGAAVRYAATGSELERVPVDYLMHRSDAGWKIAVVVLGS